MRLGTTKLAVLLACFVTWSTMDIGQSTAQEPNWYPRVLASPVERPLIEATPIELRPYRPMHFYGNTVRRSYYRGTPILLPRDVFNTTRYTIGALRPANVSSRR